MQKEFDFIMRNHFMTLEPTYKKEMRQQFAENHVVILDSLLPIPLQVALAAEAKNLMYEHGKRRDLTMKISGNTPRHYYSVGRDKVNEYGKLIPAFFHSETIREFLTYLNNDLPVHKVPYEAEEFIINRQGNIGDTHGWHWDDYTFALIWMVEAPKEGDGALIEFIPRTEWDKSDYDNCVTKVLEASDVSSMYVPENCCYFMKANTTLHRVTPLTGDSRRTVIVFTYASDEDYHSEITHESMEEIYPEDTRVV
ncbi:hypothetical protein DUZ99_02740 [Xylanibacillus composti]|uniref:Fe2OG dioxygenase domain-containing protein n=1 Tax=Xylanibacillus composti TaxID=1572762 RepID=A0A8J4H2K3_9BACL|nr:hypothetical protein [Xylanibacillus composti]MDT9723914.1 hypothetical protein [Xylanibacillus composti]GIQ67794.1 hypothetical protein XYCOK13_06180 [Xylanibacillus composti]